MSVPAALEKASPVRGNGASLSGPQKAAVVMMTLGDVTRPFWDEFDDDELREMSHAMAALGRVQAYQVEELINEFLALLAGRGVLSVNGSYDQTQKMLSQYLSDDKVSYLMEDLRGPEGRTIWEKLGNVKEDFLANYLRNEYPQTVAVILSKIKPQNSARVLACLPHEFALECIRRMLKMEPVKREIIEKIEETLRAEFMANMANTSKRDSHESMAEIFNAFDRETESRFMEALESRQKESADKIRSLMFVFEDLVKLDSGSVQTLLRAVDKTQLGLALKGANETLSDLFLSNMSERAAKLLKEDMEMLGPVKLKDVGVAQQTIVQTTKDLAENGDIMLADGGGDDELIY